ncbi:hypothetical protein [Thetidibacter halocola]|uniref:Uncharacterized protein n=1 Tax=Thetidibacter halocola TaxID=2827239 RepID=A0A8J8B942_9RHOB|nr:hypothetical protein [Thetidibacter halocola]MBS0125175.1 hypothetical protein [Thetidibacter halocola]
MVPNFALSLSFEGISLLRRVTAGWARIADVSLTETDLDHAMARLRERAVALDPRGDKVLLLLPNEQIRYLDIADPGGDVATRESATRAALDGATPYAIADLAFDHVAADGRLQIAAVARETLSEAEGFARQHGFTPVGYAARAPQGTFAGPVWFGVPDTEARRKVKRLAEAIRLVDADAEAFTPVEPPAPRERVDIRLESPAAALVEADTTPKAEPATVAPAVDKADTVFAPPAKTPEAAAATDKATNTDAQQPADAEPAAPMPSFSSLRATRDMPADSPARRITAERAPAVSGEPVRPRFTPVPPPGPATTGGAKAIPAPETADAGPSGAAASLAMRFKLRKDAPTETPAAPPAKPSEPALRAPAAQATPAPVLPTPAKPAAEPGRDLPPLTTGHGPTVPPVALPVARPATRPQGPDAPALRREGDAPADRPATSKPAAKPARDGKLAKAGGLRPVSAAPPAPQPAAKPAEPMKKPAAGSAEERDRMTVFGARNRQQVGGKPRFLGLMLTVGLLLMLVGVAAWAAVFLDDGLARLFRSTPDERAVATLSEPETTPEPATQEPAILPAPVESQVAEPAAPPAADPVTEEEPRLATLEPAPDAPASDAGLSAPVVPRALTDDEAAVSYAATGIWQRSPASPDTPPADAVDAIYVASIDPSVRQFDAVALPEERSVAPEAPLADPGLPPPAGMTFDFDARGLVRATPEGALSPEGLRIFTGPPPVVPPLREAALPTPGIVTDASPEAPAGAEPAAEPVEPPFTGIRPEARPDDIIEQRERATLQGVSKAELARLRPVLRPETAQEQAAAAEPAAPATAQAVVQSLVPVSRPRDMATIVSRVEAARPAPTIEPDEVEEEEVRTAAVAPRTVQPSIPSSASVAKAATVRNAINLSRVSLIGIYGAPSNRRALVRLPNGKYEKVKPGDRLDGGRVTAIGESNLVYQKGSRAVTLDMPRG